MEGRDASGRRRVRTGTEDVVGNRIASAFLYRFVTPQNQFLLSEGVSLPAECKTALGADFDHQLEHLGECALLHGCAWGFWNADHVEIIEAAKNAYTGFFPLLDEMTGEAKLGVQFLQIAVDRPMYVRIFDEEGVMILREDRHGLSIVQEKEPYRRTLATDALESAILVEDGYGRLPLLGGSGGHLPHRQQRRQLQRSRHGRRSPGERHRHQHHRRNRHPPAPAVWHDPAHL
jgi:hypothetical protein